MVWLKIWEMNGNIYTIYDNQTSWFLSILLAWKNNDQYQSWDLWGRACSFQTNLYECSEASMQCYPLQVISRKLAAQTLQTTALFATHWFYTPLFSWIRLDQDKIQGLVNVPIEHHPTIGDIISNRYLFWWCSKSPKRDIYQPLK